MTVGDYPSNSPFHIIDPDCHSLEVRPTSGHMAQEGQVVDELPLGGSQVANTQGSQLTDKRSSLKAVEDRVSRGVNVPKHGEVVRAIGWFQQLYALEWLRYLRFDLLARLSPYPH